MSLLARDDAENHFKFAKKFLEAGLPVLLTSLWLSICKVQTKFCPSNSMKDKFFHAVQADMLESLILMSDDLEEMGQLKKIVGYTPNSWEKYAVHLIEPMQKYISTSATIENKKVIKLPNRTP